MRISDWSSDVCSSDLPQREIAGAVNLSAAAVQRRIAAMAAAGIIERNVAIVDTRALGMTITAIVEVHLTDERPPTVDGAKALLLARSEEPTSELQSLMRISYAVFCLHKNNTQE